jgi:hypothetical protein
MAKIIALTLVAALCGCSTPAIVAVSSVGAGVEFTTGRSPVDHALSYGTDKDCQTLRVIDSKSICQDKVKPLTSVDQTEQAFAQRKGF